MNNRWRIILTTLLCVLSNCIGGAVEKFAFERRLHGIGQALSTAGTADCADFGALRANGDLVRLRFRSGKDIDIYDPVLLSHCVERSISPMCLFENCIHEYPPVLMFIVTPLSCLKLMPAWILMLAIDLTCILISIELICRASSHRWTVIGKSRLLCLLFPPNRHFFSSMADKRLQYSCFWQALHFTA